MILERGATCPSGCLGHAEWVWRMMAFLGFDVHASSEQVLRAYRAEQARWN